MSKYENRILNCRRYTSLWVKDFKGNDPKFIYYFLQLLHFENFDVGSANPTLNRNHVHKIKVKCPDLPIQRKIAGILSAYDDLIENNKRRIALLENMAEELYREWFVRFRFPGWREAEFEKGIPKGWEYDNLDNLCELIKRGVSPNYSDDSKQLVINQKCIRNGRIDLDEARSHDTKLPQEKYIQYSDALVNSTGVGTLGRVSIVEFIPDQITVDSHVTICRANIMKINSLYLSTTIAHLQSYFEIMASGSTGQVELNRSLIAGVKILVPKLEIACQFEKEIESLWKQKQVLFSIIKTLQETKNALLPRLISGKLAVEDLAVQLPPSMHPKIA